MVVVTSSLSELSDSDLLSELSELFDLLPIDFRNSTRSNASSASWQNLADKLSSPLANTTGELSHVSSSSWHVRCLITRLVEFVISQDFLN